MTSKQLMLPAHRAFDSDGAPEAGATAHLYLSGTLTPALFYDDAALTVSLGSVITANAAGRFNPMPYQDASIAFRIIIEDSEGTVLDDIDPFYFGLVPGVDGVSPAVSSRANLAATAGAVGGVRYLTEGGREGTFIWNASDLSALVTADPTQGIYVTSGTGSTGAWVRKYSGPIDPSWFGLTAGNVSANGTANSAAFSNMLAVAKAAGSYHIRFPSGTYWFSSTIDINQGNLLIEGPAGGGLEEISSVLKFPAGVTGIRIQNDTSSGATTKDGATHSSGGNTVIRNISLQGSFTTTEAEAYGIQLRRRAALENINITLFEGDGVYVSASLGAASGASPPYGNDNVSSLTRVSVSNCRNGLFFDGTDANACSIVMCNLNSNRQWGIVESSFLGNTYTGGQIATNGATAVNNGTTIGASVVSSGGNFYGAILGQEIWCSTNAPTGTTANNQGWYYISAGAPTTGKPTWVSGILVRAGGSIMCDSDTATNYFGGVYAEGDQGFAQLRESCLVAGGVLAELIFQNPVGSNTGAMFRGYQNTVRVEPCLATYSGNIVAKLGHDAALNTLNIGLNLIHTAFAPLGFQLQYTTFLSANGDLRLTYDAGDFNSFVATGPNTSVQFGTGVAQPGWLIPQKLAIADNAGNFTNSRRIMVDTTVPATGAHGQGEWQFDRSAGTNLIGNKCTTAGTPGTWSPIYGLSSTPATIATSGSASDLTTGTLPAGRFPALTGDVTTVSGALATTIAPAVVTYAKMQNVTAARLLGNPTGGATATSEISLAGGLAFSGSTLTAAGALTPTSVAATGAITGASVAVTGAVTSSSPTAGIGYASGSRGTVTQVTAKSNGVTSNTVVTDITLSAAALASATTVSFVFTNSAIGANDTLILNHVTTATFGSYLLNAHGFAAGSCTIDVRNISAGSLTEGIVIRAVVVKGG